MFDCRRAKAAVMGEVRKGKQNNFRLSALDDCFMRWHTLVEELDAFLFA